MGDNREAILEILDKAYQIETDGYTFYSMTAERATKPAVQELFGKLASDEQQHQAFLKSVAARYDEQGSAAFGLNLRMPEARDVTSQVFTGRFREQAAGAQFELAVLSIGMTLEANAISYFSNAARQAADREVREFYEFLTAWEQQHYDSLQNIFSIVRSDHMAEAGFSPI
ncbi:MAG TPA: ferritin family protein [Vicinamibacterales bacterium]|nr:ferritin family protein [Vicinamibacterales bacterium]HPW21160.1 ferritin family protein [Vicinamibacterales bacterium]